MAIKLHSVVSMNLDKKIAFEQRLSKGVGGSPYTSLQEG